MVELEEDLDLAVWEIEPPHRLEATLQRPTEEWDLTDSSRNGTGQAQLWSGPVADPQLSAQDLLARLAAELCIYGTEERVPAALLAIEPLEEKPSEQASRLKRVGWRDGLPPLCTAFTVGGQVKCALQPTLYVADGSVLVVLEEAQPHLERPGPVPSFEEWATTPWIDFPHVLRCCRATETAATFWARTGASPNPVHCPRTCYFSPQQFLHHVVAQTLLAQNADGLAGRLQFTHEGDAAYGDLALEISKQREAPHSNASFPARDPPAAEESKAAPAARAPLSVSLKSSVAFLTQYIGKAALEEEVLPWLFGDGGPCEAWACALGDVRVARRAKPASLAEIFASDTSCLDPSFGASPSAEVTAIVWFHPRSGKAFAFAYVE